MAWQVNWKVWHWPWFKQSCDRWPEMTLCAAFAGIGPFQFHWYRRGN